MNYIPYFIPDITISFEELEKILLSVLKHKGFEKISLWSQSDYEWHVVDENNTTFCQIFIYSQADNCIGALEIRFFPLHKKFSNLFVQLMVGLGDVTVKSFVTQNKFTSESHEQDCEFQNSIVTVVDLYQNKIESIVDKDIRCLVAQDYVSNRYEDENYVPRKVDIIGHEIYSQFLNDNTVSKYLRGCLYAERIYAAGLCEDVEKVEKYYQQALIIVNKSFTQLTRQYIVSRYNNAHNFTQREQIISEALEIVAANSYNFTVIHILQHLLREIKGFEEAESFIQSIHVRRKNSNAIRQLVIDIFPSRGVSSWGSFLAAVWEFQIVTLLLGAIIGIIAGIVGAGLLLKIPLRELLGREIVYAHPLFIIVFFLVLLMFAIYGALAIVIQIQSISAQYFTALKYKILTPVFKENEYDNAKGYFETLSLRYITQRFYKKWGILLALIFVLCVGVFGIAETSNSSDCYEQKSECCCVEDSNKNSDTKSDD